jgi:hypothetical protein
MPVPAFRRRAAQHRLEYRVGCAVLTLALAGRVASDLDVAELAELSGADLATVFRVLDDLAVRVPLRRSVVLPA